MKKCENDNGKCSSTHPLNCRDMGCSIRAARWHREEQAIRNKYGAMMDNEIKLLWLSREEEKENVDKR